MKQNYEHATHETKNRKRKRKFQGSLNGTAHVSTFLKRDELLYPSSKTDVSVMPTNKGLLTQVLHISQTP